MIARAKRIYILIVKVNKLFSFFSSRYFLKEIENIFSVFLSSYRNTRQSLGELGKPVEHSPAARVPTAFVVLRNFHSCFYNSIETRYMFSISLMHKPHLFAQNLGETFGLRLIYETIRNSGSDDLINIHKDDCE